MIRGAQLFSTGTSHGSTIPDCGEPFKLRLTLSEDRRLPLTRKSAEIYGPVGKADATWPPAPPPQRSAQVIEVRNQRYRTAESRWQACFSRHFGPGPRMQMPRADIAVQTQPFRRNRQYSVPQIATITPMTRK